MKYIFEELAPRIAKEMYDERCLMELLTINGCTPVSVSTKKRLLSLGWAPSGYIAERFSLGSDASYRPGCILCSPCIDHCGAKPELLAATVISDLIHGATVAWAFGVPLVGFIPVGQEIYLETCGEANDKGWQSVADRVEEIFNQLRLPPRSRLVSTADTDVWNALGVSVQRRRCDLPTSSLDGLYHLTDGSFYPAGTPFQFYYEHYRINIAQYDQNVIENIFELSTPLVVENLQQVKAIFLADEVTSKPHTTSALLTVPAPGQSISMRATRSAADALYLLNDFLESRTVSKDKYVNQYWSTVGTAWEQLTK